MDSDDFLQPRFIESMYEEMIKNDADLVECAYSIWWSEKSKLARFSDLPINSFITDNKSDFIDKVFRQTVINGNLPVVVWNKMYRRKLIEETVSDYGNDLLEDYLFNLQYYLKVNKYSYISEPQISYRILFNSTSRSFNPKMLEVLVDLDKKKRVIMSELGIYQLEDRKEANR